MSLKFVDLFAGLGGFHVALERLGIECVFASEIDDELRQGYSKNFPEMKGRVLGDIRDSETKAKIPAHDVLCAGFPCQPFSKSGFQLGELDETRGTLFRDILDILEAHRPKYVILENVGNFERHDHGNTWTVVRQKLQGLGYYVRGTEHRRSGGHGLLSPHHLGLPHTRERFFAVASRQPLEGDPFPSSSTRPPTKLIDLLQGNGELSREDMAETRLTTRQVQCIDHWNELLEKIPLEVPLPSFPIWSDEFGASYPYSERTPSDCTEEELRAHLNGTAPGGPVEKEQLLLLFPSYSRVQGPFPDWKHRFIRQNREWCEQLEKCLPAAWFEAWLQQLRTEFPSSLRKLEWNCKGEERNLWNFVLQFRPSGLRAKRFEAVPALVAMTTTQIPVLGPMRRFITRVEGLRLQGFEDAHVLPSSREAAFRSLGNAVHVDVAEAVARGLIRELADEPTDFVFDRRPTVRELQRPLPVVT